jgi:uncharacterized protein YcfL
MKNLLFDDGPSRWTASCSRAPITAYALCSTSSQKDARGNYPIYWYDHEGNAMEPFAPTFAEAIKAIRHEDIND